MDSPCVQINLNQLIKKHYIRQKGECDLTTTAQDIQAQLKIYENAINEILDECSWGIYHPKDMNPAMKVQMKGRPKQIFTHLYTIYGDCITNLLQVEHDAQFLVASTTGKFQGLKTNELFNNDESGKSILNRLVSRSPIKTSPASPRSNLPDQEIDKTDKTFQLTSVTASSP